MSDLELTGSPDTTSTSRHSPKDYHHKKVSHGLMLVVYFGVHTWARIKDLLKDPARISRSNMCVYEYIYHTHCETCQQGFGSGSGSGVFA